MSLPTGWVKTTLSKVCSKITDGTHDTPQKLESGVPFITGVHVKDGLIDFKQSSFVSEKDHAEIYRRCNPEYGDVLLVNIGAGTGSVAFVNADYPFSMKNVALLKPDKNKLDGKYLESYQLFIKKHLIRTLLSGGAQPFLGLDQIGKLSIVVPPVEEQKKIAEILSTWDKAIRVADDSLIKVKKLQIQTIKDLCFPGIKNRDQKWESVSIGSQLIETGSQTAWNDEKMYMLASIRRRSGGIFHRESLLGSQILTKKLKEILKPCFLIFRMQVVHGAWSLASVEHVGMFVSESYDMLVPSQNARLDLRFFDYMSKAKRMYRKALICSHGVHIEKMTFNLEDFLNEQIHVPEMVYQNRVVDILTALDREIILRQRYIEKLRSQKQGLMQKLLTGKVRVKV